MKNRTHSFRILNLFAFLLIFLSNRLFGAEIVFSNGEAYIAETVSDTEKQLKVKWKDKIYTLYKSDIAHVDYSKKGEDTSYYYSTLELHDGSRIKGVFAEESSDEVTLKTELGFLTIPKTNLKNPSALRKGSPSLSDALLDPEAQHPETKLGVYGDLLINFGPNRNLFPASYGGGVFIEPAFLNWNNKWQIGFRSDYLSAPGPNGNFSFLTNQVYAQYNKVYKNDPFLDFFINVGAGVSDVRYVTGYTTSAGIDPALSFQLGWQGIKFSNFQVRLSWKNQCIFERTSDICMSGLEAGILVRL
ncbi:hypothetical protein LEP1GSC050_4166 [Leptospira broomii serovar Hurstbridge str. 5399]|uniref:Uncharacterized protein n=1 Tax=Leptospira broomii serovar Hurstbridge str. 5399 TaxID=1049789 RepID=T0GF01_9LEPT|nr:hypothetical protein [Leptospira broomii]EQA45409.1 hypothetical protein LEP1GSC050_4166 [Leptospira broomii serovar Hurstbridge str. 5399]